MKNLSLSSKIIMWITVLVIIAVAVISFFLPYRLSDHYERQVTDHLKTIVMYSLDEVDVLDLQEGYYYLNIDKDYIHTHIGPLGETEYINSRLVTTFIKNGSTQLDNVKSYESTIDGRKMYYTIRRDESNYTIAYAYESTLIQLTQQITGDVVTFIFVIFLALLILSMIFIKNITKSLNILSGYIKTLATDHYAENPIKKYNEDEIGTLIKYINHLQQELIAGEKQQKEMFQNISHDLKTPILVIKGYTMALMDGTFQGDEKDRVLNIVLDETERLTKKVNDLLYLSKLDVIQKRHLSDEIVTFRVDELVGKIISNFEVTRPDLSFEFDFEPTKFKGDVEKWHVVIENILDNFLRYAKSKIKVTILNGRIVLFNDGESVDETIIHDLLEPYVTGNKGKFGLGLAIANKTLKNYGYLLTVRNVPNGVEFLIEPKGGNKS